MFSDLYAAVIHVGENTGRLDEAFRRIAQYLELERETIKRLKSATRYPSFVLIAIGVAIAILNVFVIPAFADVFAKFHAQLPWQTQVILAISQFFVAFWPYLLAGCWASRSRIKRWVETDDGRHAWDRWKLKLPIVGPIFERINLARFCQTFAMVMRSRVCRLRRVSRRGRCDRQRVHVAARARHARRYRARREHHDHRGRQRHVHAGRACR